MKRDTLRIVRCMAIKSEPKLPSAGFRESFGYCAAATAGWNVRMPDERGRACAFGIPRRPRRTGGRWATSAGVGMSRRGIGENHRAAEAPAVGRWDSGFLAEAAFETLSNRRQGAAAAAFVPKERVCADSTRRAGSGLAPPRREQRTFLRARRSRAALAIPAAGATASALAQVSIASTPANGSHCADDELFGRESKRPFRKLPALPKETARRRGIARQGRNSSLMFLVRAAGLEPARPKPRDFKSLVFTCFTTPA